MAKKKRGKRDCPNREPDLILYDRDAKPSGYRFWFEEKLYSWYTTSGLAIGPWKMMNPKDEMLYWEECDNEGRGKVFKEAYMGWLTEKFLLGGKSD